MPVYYGIVTATCLASLGLPGLAGFISEFLVFRGALSIIPLIATIAISGVVVTAAMFLWKVIQLIFLGPLNEKWADLPDMYRWEVITMAPLLFFMVLFGLYPTPILNLINGTVVKLLSGL
jgi:NADH-quinone oxidoreductase subunit M